MTREAITSTLISAADCHLCGHARQVLERVRSDHPILIREIDWQSAEGSSLVGRDGVPFPPAFYLGDSCLGYGRLSERALRRRLKETAP